MTVVTTATLVGSDIRDQPLQFVKGVGPRMAEVFAKLELHTVGDFFNYIPRSYQDRRQISPIVRLESGEQVLCFGAVRSASLEKAKKTHIFKAIIQDASGSLVAIWFNQPYLKKVITPGKQIIINGKLQFNAYSGERQLTVIDWELYDPVTDQGLSLGIVVPIYGLTQGLYQNKVRKIARGIVSDLLPRIEDPLPEGLRDAWNLAPLAESLRQLHFPESREAYKAARRRVAFDEFFYLQLALLLKRREQKVLPKAIRMQAEGPMLQQFIDVLPFKLTGAQARVISEIKADMASSEVMNRLVQGDVGSGKTEVAVAAMAVAVQSGCQTVLMAPTEILAEQHHYKVRRYLNSLEIPCYFLAGKLTVKQKQAVRQAIETGAPCVVVGTHALIQEPVRFERLGLVVVDEQHRFGVQQRNELQKKGYYPDMLMLTATPIPRSLSLTLYGDLDKSIMDEYPPGRQPIETYRLTPGRKREAYEFARLHLRAGERIYVVFPLVETSPKLELQAATQSAQHIQTQIFPEFKVGLLHGRMKPDEKTAVMESFRRGDIQVLVATTVIEVGVDVPEATVIIIEHAERFGLSQLHQLRGRVGRGTQKGYCLLIGEPKGDESRRRLQALVQCRDGFKIAEADLQIRGPGDFFGVRQSGLPDFKVADLIRDEKILIEAKKRAQECLQTPRTLAPTLEHELYRRMKEFLGGTRLN